MYRHVFVYAVYIVAQVMHCGMQQNKANQKTTNNEWGLTVKTTTLQKTRTQVGTTGKIDEQIYKVGIVVVGLSSLAIGVWATVALVSGMVASGGPGALVSDWFRAVLGL